MDIKKKEQEFINKLKSLPTKTVPLYLNSAQDLIDSNNFAGPDALILNPAVKEYLDKAAAEIPINNSITIELHFRERLTIKEKKIDCKKIIQDYYTKELETKFAEHKKNTKHWQFQLFLGLIVLAIFHVISILINTFADNSVSELLTTSFEIMGWVAIWEPSTYFLFRRKEESHFISDCFQLKNCNLVIADN